MLGRHLVSVMCPMGVFLSMSSNFKRLSFRKSKVKKNYVVKKRQIQKKVVFTEVSYRFGYVIGHSKKVLKRGDRM